SRKPDLIVDDDVNRTAGAIAMKLCELQRLHHDALSGKRCVAVHQHGQDAFSRSFARLVRVGNLVLRGACHAFNDGIDRFEMAGIWRQTQIDIFPGRRLALAFGALVVFHVAFVGRKRWMDRTFKRSEDAFAKMPDDVGEHVQASAVRHAHRDLFDAELARAFGQLIEERNDRLAALDGKSLLAEILGVQELFELLGGNQLPRNSFLNFHVNWFGMHELAANLLTQPELFFFTLDVAIFRADFAAVGALQDVENLAQRRRLSSTKTSGNEQAIEIPNRQIVSFDVE